MTATVKTDNPMQTHIICHCRKCKVQCNKHNKRAKCSDCGKRRMLGTAITRGIIRHICNECCKSLEPSRSRDPADLQQMYQELRSSPGID